MQRKTACCLSNCHDSPCSFLRAQLVVDLHGDSMPMSHNAFQHMLHSKTCVSISLVALLLLLDQFARPMNFRGCRISLGLSHLHFDEHSLILATRTAFARRATATAFTYLFFRIHRLGRLPTCDAPYQTTHSTTTTSKSTHHGSLHTPPRTTSAPCRLRSSCACRPAWFISHPHHPWRHTAA